MTVLSRRKSARFLSNVSENRRKAFTIFTMTLFKIGCIFLTEKHDFWIHHINLVLDRSIGTRCPVDYINFIDDMNHRRTIECYNDDSTNKGLLAIARELGLAIPNKCSLSELKAVLWMHNAFKSVSNQYLDTL